MTDLIEIERVAAKAQWTKVYTNPNAPLDALKWEAGAGPAFDADKSLSVERLRAHVRALEAALRKIRDETSEPGSPSYETARAAIGDKP